MGSIATYNDKIQAIEAEALQTDGTPEVLYPYLSKAYYLQKDIIAMMLEEVPTSNTDECLPLIEAADARAATAVETCTALNKQMEAQAEEIVQLEKALATAIADKSEALKIARSNCDLTTAKLREYEITVEKLREVLQ